MTEWDNYIWSIHRVKHSPLFLLGGGLKVFVKRQNQYYNDLCSYDPDASFDSFDIAFSKFEAELERIEKLGWFRRWLANRKRKRDMSCFDCEYETVYEGWCCEHGFNEYPSQAYNCALFNKR